MTNDPQWIPVSERLPEHMVDVLVAIKWMEKPAKAHYNEGGKCWVESLEYAELRGDGWLNDYIPASEVTHWMPLPAMPEISN